MNGKVKQFGSVWFGVCLAACLLVWGCIDEVDGVPCVEHADCGDGNCVDGTCVPVISSAGDGDTDVDADGDTDADADVVPDEPYSLPMAAVDILLVVDDTGSMIQEQEVLTTSVFNLINNITEDMLGAVGPVTDALDIRVAVTTTDMGVSFDGQPYVGSFTPHAVCTEGDGFGNDGKFVTEYLTASAGMAYGNEILCSKTDNACPPDWACTNINAYGVGYCVPLNETEEIVCPDFNAFLTDDMYLVPDNENAATMEYGYREFVATSACLSMVGTEGCAFEQQLSAVSAAMTKHGQAVFLREDALTVVIVVSDENDCSLASDQWHSVPELGTNERNIACGRHSDLLMDVSEIKRQIISAKTTATGVPAAGSIVFAAITGVPPVDDCQGFGSDLDNCGDVPLAYGTMSAPAVIERNDPNGNLAFYFEYACERWDNDNNAITLAYPATRIVDLAQQFGEFGYVYSICNEDWTPAMDAISAKIAASLNR